MIWPVDDQTALREMPITDVILKMLPFAEEGLAQLGVGDSEIKRVLAPIRKRIESGVTGARWQRRMLARIEERDGKENACSHMLENYIREFSRDVDVSEWSDEI